MSGNNAYNEQFSLVSWTSIHKNKISNALCSQKLTPPENACEVISVRPL